MLRERLILTKIYRPRTPGGQFSEGFTLIESLVAIMLLSVAITPAVYMAVVSVQTADLVKNSMIAANLAQEGMEVIRNIRDTSWINGASDTGLSMGDYEIQYDSSSPVGYTTGQLLINDKGAYVLVSSCNTSICHPTPFARKISISTPGNYEIKVISEVDWTERHIAKSIKVESHLFNWR